MQGLYIKKKEIDARGDRPPIDLLEKVKSLIGDLKAKKNRIENQKIQFATKFEKKRANLGDAALNSSSLAGLSSSIFKIKGIDKEVADLSMRMNKVEDMKASFAHPERPAQDHGQQSGGSRPENRRDGAEGRSQLLRAEPAEPDHEHARLREEKQEPLRTSDFTRNSQRFLLDYSRLQLGHDAESPGQPGRHHERSEPEHLCSSLRKRPHERIRASAEQRLAGHAGEQSEHDEEHGHHVQP